uniref:Uncharacterized protein n=1 Tax=Rhizophagus irregularis (strain DAOM 181602 / DAOM 197198 / MUCL 43194) TaxID=747089 RepID=U9TL90_RHIID
MRSHIPPNAPYVKNFGEKFGKAFGKALNFKFEENIFFSAQLVKKIFNKGSEDPKWIRALEAFKRASADDAKKSADGRNYLTNVILILARSAWSHAKAVIDLSGEESMKYLTEKRKINKFERTTRSAAPQRKHIKHGRIIDLGDVADDFLAKKPFEDIKGQILAKVQKKFESSAELLQDQTHHEAGKSVIDALLKSKEINTDVPVP